VDYTYLIPALTLSISVYRLYLFDIQTVLSGQTKQHVG